MQAQRTRKQRKAITRQTLKDAALRCFGELGYGSTSIGAITTEAGVAHGTFYVHFASKEAAFDELLSDFYQGFTHEVIPILGELTDAPLSEVIRDLAVVFFDYGERHRAFVESYVQRAATGLSLTELRDGVSPSFVNTLSIGLAEAARRAGDELPNPELVVQTFLAMWFRIGLQALSNPKVDREQALDLLVQMTWGALSAVVPRLGHKGLTA